MGSRSAPGDDPNQDDRAPDWLLPPDDGSMGRDLPPVEDLRLDDDGQSHHRGQPIPDNDLRPIIRRLKREAAQKLPSAFARTTLKLPRLRLQPHRRHREQRPRARCGSRAGPDDDGGGDGGGPPDGPELPSVAELLDRLSPFADLGLVVFVLLRRWST